MGFYQIINIRIIEHNKLKTNAQLWIINDVIIIITAIIANSRFNWTGFD